MPEETQTQILDLESVDAKKATSRSRKAGLVFPVRHVVRSLKAGKYSDSIGFGAPIYLAAVLEYVAVEVLELAGNAAIEKKKTRITPEHIKSVLEKDEELKMLLGHINIDDNGNVVPNNSKHSILPLTLRKKVNCSKLLRRNSKGLLGVVALATGLYLGRVINNFN